MVLNNNHLRTLLLTFFYRQLPEVIEKGYLYIAQPPLLKIGKGKNEIYLKDETQLNDHILKNACDKKVLTIGSNPVKLSDHNLYMFMCNLSEYFSVLKKLERRGIHSDLIELLLKKGVKDKAFMQDPQQMTVLKSALIEQGYDSEALSWNTERNVYEMKVIPDGDGSGQSIIGSTRTIDIQPIIIGRGLIYSEDYQKCLMLSKEIFKYDKPPFAFYRKDKEKEQEPRIFNDKKRLISHLFDEGKKGMSVQRYKGLGEMNPDQLWDTTMNPERRNLLQVKIEDAVDTDEIFTVLMGDEVEPRREFIQTNALEVTMLDI